MLVEFGILGMKASLKVAPDITRSWWMLHYNIFMYMMKLWQLIHEAIMLARMFGDLLERECVS